jgi:ribonucleoside-triphosphate reductase
MITVIKKNGTTEKFDYNKIVKAINKSANRISINLTEKEEVGVFTYVLDNINNDKIVVDDLHSLVEMALEKINPSVAKSYKDYRNYKNEFGVFLMDDIERQVNQILYDVDRENANSNTAYISTKRTEVAKTFAKELYQKTYLSTDTLQAIKDGYIYIHDLSDMILQQYNCCLTRYADILDGGFELENIKYTEPKDITTAIGQLSDLIMTISAQHFGGHTVPEIDKVLLKYYKQTIDKYADEFLKLFIEFNPLQKNPILLTEYAYKKAREKAYKDLEQGLQGLEIKLNTVVSARGSFPFSTITFGNIEQDDRLDRELQAEIARCILDVRMKGHGEDGKRKNMIFPKLVFLYSEEIHGDRKEFEWLFDRAVECSSKCMYPDFIGKGHKREGKFVSPMGCRAYLSNWYHNPNDKYDIGSPTPRDENDEIVFEGRFNLAAVSLNLPMIYAKSKEEGEDFWDVLDYYLELIRKVHLDRIEYVGKAKASSNPLMFCEGGALGGYLNPEDRIAPLLKYTTISFGVTALHELTVLATGKTLKEDSSFASEVLDFLNSSLERYKKEDGVLYALYSTPAESLCGTQVKQFRAKYGVIEGVSDRDYFSNSFHMHVTEDITPFEKQDLENDLFHKTAGGHIQYVRISNPDNIKGLKATIKRGLDNGFYQGVNFDASMCEDCGTKGNDWENDICPNCGSENVNVISRTCGYLGAKRVKGDTRFNDAKLKEIEDRKSM